MVRLFHMGLLSLAAFYLGLGAGESLAKGKGKSRAKESSESSAMGPSWRGPYGMAGCGWGGVAVGNNPSPLAQVGAVILNGICTNQMSALTSGTSNCDKSSADVAAMEQEVFVTSNLASLTIESARGEGEHLEAFAELLGCTEDLAAFTRLCQKDHQDIFADGDAKALLERLRKALRQDPELSCQRV